MEFEKICWSDCKVSSSLEKGESDILAKVFFLKELEEDLCFEGWERVFERGEYFREGKVVWVKLKN